MPSVANNAFALELYLKSLIVLDTNEEPNWKHDYVYLFGILKPETQAKIKETHENSRGRAIQKILVKAGAIDRTFDQKLESMKNAFRDIRYIYEGYRPNFEGDIAGAILDVLMERRPDWFK